MTKHGPGALARLTRAALRAAEAEGFRDAERAAGFLYRFNTVVPTERWKAQHRGRESVAEIWGAVRGSESRSRLQQHWLEAEKDSSSGWWAWTPRRSGAELGGEGVRFKLYVSPAIEALRPAFEALVSVLAGSGAPPFKVGADAGGLFRPDKIIVYFSDLGDLTTAAHRLADRLQGVEAQGVPFTAEIAGGGLLSWSVDPPVSTGQASGPPQSWRTWITLRAALALIAAQRQQDPRTAPWRRALEQLRGEGVDVERWVPSPTQWTSADGWR